MWGWWMLLRLKRHPPPIFHWNLKNEWRVYQEAHWEDSQPNTWQSSTRNTFEPYDGWFFQGKGAEFHLYPATQL